MKKFANIFLALSIAAFASVALTACDDDDAVTNGFVLQNN